MSSTKFLPALRSMREVSQVRKRASPGERILASLFPSRGVGWPGGWSQDRIEQILHFKNWSYIAISAICMKLAQIIPNMAYLRHRHIPGHTYKCWDQFADFGGTRSIDMSGHRFPSTRKALSVVKPHEELEPVEQDHPLRRLIENPNPVDTSFDLLYELCMFLELCGVAYLWKVPNKWGTPCELWVIPSHWVWPRTGRGKYIDPEDPSAEHLIHYYEVRPWGGMGSAGMLKFPHNEIVMIHWKSPMNKLDGYSRLAAAAQWIDTEESISKSRWSQFVNQARPEFWVELGEGFEDPDDDRISRLEAKFAAKYQGEYNFGKPIFTPNGAKVTPLSFNPTEMSYCQSEEQVRDLILSTFGVPPAAVGIVKDMTYGSVLATLCQFCVFTLNPRLVMLGQKLTKLLAPSFMRDKNDPIRIWWDDCTPSDPQQINADIQADAQHGAITPNEIRALRGRNGYRHGGDDPLLPGPGGTIPLPLNTGKDLTNIADLIPDFANLGREEPTAQGTEGAVSTGGTPPSPAEGDFGTEMPDMDMEVTMPNGAPMKNLDRHRETLRRISEETKKLKKVVDNRPVEKRSYFENCERDDEGHCKPQGSGMPLLNPPRRGAQQESETAAVRKPRSGLAQTHRPPKKVDPAHKTRPRARLDLMSAVGGGGKLPPYVTPSMLKEDWKNIRVADKTESALKVVATDKDGGPVALFSGPGMDVAAAKFAKILEGLTNLPRFLGKLKEARQAKKKGTTEEADALWMISVQGFSVDAVLNLKGGDVSLNDDVVRLHLKGGGVEFDRIICQFELAVMLVDRTKNLKVSDPLFKTDQEKLDHFLNSLVGGYSTHDLRSIRATRAALDEVERMPDPKDQESYIRSVMEVATIVGKLVGEAPRSALTNLISPTVFAGWRAKLSSD